jgi:SAM-dependent methyltransferase
MAEQHFGKYELDGAYHWRIAIDRGFRSCPQLNARYDIPLDTVDPSARRALDIGCGDGGLSSLKPALGKWVDGFDNSPEGLRVFGPTHLGQRLEHARRDCARPGHSRRSGPLRVVD